MKRKIISLVTAGALLVAPGVGRSEPPPSPPDGHPPVRVEAGAAWSAPPGGGICLDLEAARYQDQVRGYYEARVKAGEKVAEERGIKGFVAGLALGLLAAGITVAATR